MPDLSLFPERYPSVRSVRFGARVELATVQWSLADYLNELKPWKVEAHEVA